MEKETLLERAAVHRHLYKTSPRYRVIFGLQAILTGGLFLGIPLGFVYIAWSWWHWGLPKEFTLDFVLTSGMSVTFWVSMFLVRPLKKWWARRSVSGCDSPFQSDTEADEPSRLLEFCLRLFFSRATCEAILGDLDEQFDLDCTRFGRKRAQVLRACDLTRSLWPFISGAVRKLVRWGAFASAVEWVRRLI